MIIDSLEVHFHLSLFAPETHIHFAKLGASKSFELESTVFILFDI